MRLLGMCLSIPNGALPALALTSARDNAPEADARVPRRGRVVEAQREDARPRSVGIGPAMDGRSRKTRRPGWCRRHAVGVRVGINVPKRVAIVRRVRDERPRGGHGCRGAALARPGIPLAGPLGQVPAHVLGAPVAHAAGRVGHRRGRSLSRGRASCWTIACCTPGSCSRRSLRSLGCRAQPPTTLRPSGAASRLRDRARLPETR